MNNYLKGVNLYGELCHLRQPQKPDYKYLQKILRDSKTMESIKEYFKDTLWTDADIFERYESYRSMQAQGTAIDFVVGLNSTGQIVGECGFKNIENNSAEFGIILHSSVWGKSIAYECFQMCLKYAFETLKWNSVYFKTLRNNLRMRRFFEKINIPLLSESEECHYQVHLNNWPSVAKMLGL